VQLEADPPLDDTLLAALEPFVLEASHRQSRASSAYVSAWRRAAACESVANEPKWTRYALSPRSTRGAARA
jgi:hypothetical protein